MLPTEIPVKLYTEIIGNYKNHMKNTCVDKMESFLVFILAVQIVTTGV